MPALAHPLEQRLAQPQRRRGVADEPGGLLLGLGLGQQLDAVLRSEIVELIRSAARLDQVRRDHRVVGRFDAQGLGVMRDELALELLRRRPDNNLVLSRERGAIGVRGESPGA